MSHTNPLPSLPDVQAFQNTDREVWRETPGDFYSNSVHLTATGGLGINVGGTVYVKPPAEWHRLASGARSTAAQPADAGPWSLTEAGSLQSADFTHDVQLGISGDFTNKDERLAYARGLCAKLNAAAAQPARLTIDELARTAYLVFCDAQDDSGWESLNDGERQSFTRVAEALNGTIAEMGSAAAQPVEPTVTPTEAVVGFASWVTCRPGTLPAGEGHDAAPWSEAVHEFVVAQGWPTVRDVFPHNLKRPPLSAPPAASGDSTPPSDPADGEQLWLWRNGDHFLAFRPNRPAQPSQRPPGAPMSERERFLADKSPGSEWHLTMLMAPYHLNFFVGQDRQHLLAWGRDVWNAARSGQAASGSQENARSDDRTGWPPGLLQDDSRELSRALASKPDAMVHARDAVAKIGQPEAPTAAPLEPATWQMRTRFRDGEWSRWSECADLPRGEALEQATGPLTMQFRPLYAHPPARSGAGSEEGQ